MNAEHEQTTDDTDANTTTETWNHTSVDRRTFIKSVGAAAGAAATGAGPAAAQTSTETTTETQTDTTGVNEAPNSLADDVVEVDYALQNRAKTAAAVPMLLASPVAGTIYAGAETSDEIEYAVSNMATWAWGQITPDAEEAQNDQLELDVNAHAHTIRDNLGMLAKLCYNNFEMLDNNALISGEVAAVKAINNGKAESLVAAQAQEEIYNQIAVYEENFYRILETAIVRLANLHAQQVIGFGNDPDYEPTIKYRPVETSDYTHDIIGTRDIEVELVNGDTITTQALACNDGSLQEEAGVVYIHPLFGKPGKVNNYDELEDSSNNSQTIENLATSWHASSDASRVALYVEQYDSNNGRVYPFHTDHEGLIEELTETSAYGHGWTAFIEEHVIQRAATLTNDMQQYVSDLFDALATGEIENVEEVMSPYAFMQLQAGDWLQTGSTGFPAAAAWMGGYSTDLERTGTYTHVDADADNITYDEANLLWDAENPPKLGNLSSEELGGTDWTINTPIGSGSTLHVDTYPPVAGMEFTASHSSDSVDSIGVQIGTGDSATPVAAKSATSSISPTQRELEDALSRHNVSHGDTVTISVEVTTDAGSTTTVSATNVEVLVETRLHVGNEYNVPGGTTVYIADSNGMHEVATGDSVIIDSVKDADGNTMDYIEITDGTLMTLDDTSDIQDRWDDILEAQRDTEDETPDGDGNIGPGGGGGSGLPDLGGESIPWTAIAGGGGVLFVLSVIAQLLEGGGSQ